MKPILYDFGETDFISNGLGRLDDCIECLVTEERNGVFECDFTYPVTGRRFDDILLGRSIAITHDDAGDVQPFDIVSMSRPIDGVVSFHAVHISYRLTGIVAKAKNINSLDAALQALVETAQPSDEMTFNFQTDFSRNGFCAAFDGIPRTVRQLLGGIEGSILDTYGGEFEFNGFNVILHKARGQQRDFSIRYGVNMTEYQDDTDYQGTFTSCVPYWSGGDGGVIVTANPLKVDSGLPSYDGRDTCVPLDLTDRFEDKPTRAQLRAEALAVMQSRQTNLPSQNITVNFLRLQDFPEYAEFTSLLECKLCDSIDVIFPRYGMSGSFKIVKTVWNALAGRYDSMELGNLQTSLADALGLTETSQGRVIDGRVYVNSDDDVEVLGDMNVTGYVEGLFKITTCAVTVGAINANSYEASTAHAMTAQSGYHAAAITGWTTSNFRIRPTTHRIDSDTELTAGFANTSDTNVAAGATVKFRVLWLKATSA